MLINAVKLHYILCTSAPAAGLTTTISSTSSAPGAAPTSLQHSLPEDSMRYRIQHGNPSISHTTTHTRLLRLPYNSFRADFLEIVRDMYQRSRLFQKSKPKVLSAIFLVNGRDYEKETMHR